MGDCEVAEVILFWVFYLVGVAVCAPMIALLVAFEYKRQFPQLPFTSGDCGYASVIGVSLAFIWPVAIGIGGPLLAVALIVRKWGPK